MIALSFRHHHFTPDKTFLNFFAKLGKSLGDYTRAFFFFLA